MNDKKIDPIIEELFQENETITKNIRIGLTRLIILWEINKGPTYGYDLMKTIDKFFKNEIKYGVIKKANASKIYPILKKFEKGEVIKGEWVIKNNKQIKIYTITEKGKKTIKIMKEKMKIVLKEDHWRELLTEFTGLK